MGENRGRCPGGDGRDSCGGRLTPLRTHEASDEIGIPAGVLLGRFERGAERSADDGSGLGLYVSRELCRAMQGDLVLEPHDPGRGAAFSIYLPGEPPEDG